MLKKLAQILFLTFVLSSEVKADYFTTYTIASIDYLDPCTIVLSEGSTWVVDSANLPSIASFVKGGPVFIVPLLQSGGYGPNMTAVLFYGQPPFPTVTAYATLNQGSTTYSIQSLDLTAGTLVVQDNANPPHLTYWTVDPAYMKYFVSPNWQKDDPVTPVGYRIQKYLINGTNRDTQQTFVNARTHTP